MLEDVLIILFLYLLCGALMVFASQQGWLRIPIVPIIGGFTFTGLFSFGISMPDPVKVIAFALFTGLLFWLGRYNPKPVI